MERVARFAALVAAAPDDAEGEFRARAVQRERPESAVASLAAGAASLPWVVSPRVADDPSGVLVLTRSGAGPGFSMLSARLDTLAGDEPRIR